MYFVAVTFSTLCSAYSLIVLLRCLLSWFDYSRSSKAFEICFVMTEPILAPIRDFLHRFEVLRSCPIDLAPWVFILLLDALSGLLFLFV